MPLPKIPSVKPVIVPATTEKEYPDNFLTRLVIQAFPNSNEKWTAQMQFRAFNYETGETGLKMTNVMINDLLAESARSTVFAQTLGMVINTIGLHMAEKKATTELSEANALPNNDPTKVQKIADATTALNTARSNYGVA